MPARMIEADPPQRGHAARAPRDNPANTFWDPFRRLNAIEGRDDQDFDIMAFRNLDRAHGTMSGLGRFTRGDHYTECDRTRAHST